MVLEHTSWSWSIHLQHSTSSKSTLQSSEEDSTALDNTPGVLLKRTSMFQGTDLEHTQ